MNSWLWLLAALCMAGSPRPFAAGPETLRLWDGTPPLASAGDPAEHYLPPDAGQDPDITRLANVSEPSLSVFRPSTDRNTGACVLICPGGGYQILAMKHEGTQVADWLNSIGVTSVVLKYRVPAPEGEPPYLRPLLDGQRALSLIRTHAREWSVDPGRIGVLGFSAGGNLAAWLLCEGNRHPPAYPNQPGEPSCRPDFGILLYPAYLADPKRPGDKPAIRADAPPGPVFFVQAADDPLGAENSIEFFRDLKRAGVPGELHVYQQGGHGFGMLRQGKPVNDWPARCAEWLHAQDWLQQR